MKSALFSLALFTPSLFALNNHDVVVAAGLETTPEHIAAVNYLRNTLPVNERINTPSIHEILETAYIRAPLPNGLGLPMPPIGLILAHSTAREWASRFFNDPSRSIVSATMYFIANIDPHPNKNEITAVENLQTDFVLAPMFENITREIVNAYIYLRSKKDQRYISKQFIRNTIHLQDTMKVVYPNLDDLFYVSRFFHRIGRMPSLEDKRRFDHLLKILPLGEIGSGEFSLMTTVVDFLGKYDISEEEFSQAESIGEEILKMEGAKDLGIEGLASAVSEAKNLGFPHPKPSDLQMLSSLKVLFDIDKLSKREVDRFLYLRDTLQIIVNDITRELLGHLAYLIDTLHVEKPTTADLKRLSYIRHKWIANPTKHDWESIDQLLGDVSDEGENSFSSIMHYLVDTIEITTPQIQDLATLTFIRKELDLAKPSARQFKVVDYALNSLKRDKISRDFLNTLDHCLFNLKIEDPSNEEIEFILAYKAKNQLGEEIATASFFKWLREEVFGKNSNGFIAVAPKGFPRATVIWQAEARDTRQLVEFLRKKPNKNITVSLGHKNPIEKLTGLRLTNTKNQYDVMPFTKKGQGKSNEDIDGSSNKEKYSIIDYKIGLNKPPSQLGLSYYKLKKTNRVLIVFKNIVINKESDEVTLK